MEHFNAYRMIARIECATRMIMLRYNLTTRQANADLMSTIVALSAHPNVYDYDRAVLQQMAVALAGYVKQTESLNFTQEQVNESDALGEREALFIFQRYPSEYADKILSLTDFDQERKEYERQRARRRRRNLFIFLGAVACLIIGIWVYNLPYFAEKRAFNKLQDDFNSGYVSSYAISQYYDKYPDGAHMEDVMIFEVESYTVDYEFDSRISAIHNYLSKYPEGRKAAEYRKFLDNLWVNGIAQYKSTVGDSPNDAQKFMINMLEYMYANKFTQVYVVVHPELKLKDFKNYPSAIQQSLRYDLSQYFTTDIDSKIKSVKSEITENSVNGWASDIVSTLSNSTKALFKTQIIDFETVTPDAIPADSRNPIIHLHYTVSNQEEYPGYPATWIYYEYSFYNYTQKNYKYVMLGIQMSFKAQFEIPGTDLQYTLTAKGDPGSADIQDATYPYRVMSERCSKGFYDKVVNNFSLTTE
ncbi:MAG: hypothetical protein ACI4AM_07030 [Muribaculaceae bacterium]